ncbi:hypothetical protein [Sphingobium algorifonticola]|uniref:hypothetical protein n=1 Tax=Sphingobium algorifonticola TaxID=2008318 RepID=UPI0013E2CB45|nr:hypothetical protein [Sphingobium algorifonticola]
MNIGVTKDNDGPGKNRHTGALHGHGLRRFFRDDLYLPFPRRVARPIAQASPGLII